ncbi:hypothetical protein [Streptomyces sp. NPDC050164]|uniref:hypothetical protein n=1 Tax=Streptomyces sp. NPDC050164 TaxID=3365605 RepID=UPI003795A12C
MTTVTLPTVPLAPQPRDGADRRLPGRYTVTPGRSLIELTAWCGPLPLLRRRVTLGEASLTVSEDAEHPSFRYEFDDRLLSAACPAAVPAAAPRHRGHPVSAAGRGGVRVRAARRTARGGAVSAVLALRALPLLPGQASAASYRPPTTRMPSSSPSSVFPAAVGQSPQASPSSPAAQVAQQPQTRTTASATRPLAPCSCRPASSPG